MRGGKAKSAGALIDAPVWGELGEGKALRLGEGCPEIVALALLAAVKRIAQRDTRIVYQEARIAELQRQCQDQPPSPATPSVHRFSDESGKRHEMYRSSDGFDVLLTSGITQHANRFFRRYVCIAMQPGSRPITTVRASRVTAVHQIGYAAGRSAGEIFVALRNS